MNCKHCEHELTEPPLSWERNSGPTHRYPTLSFSGKLQRKPNTTVFSLLYNAFILLDVPKRGRGLQG